MTSFDGFRLDMLGCQQLVLESCNVGDALLLEGLETGIKRLLQTDTKKKILSTEAATWHRREVEGRFRGWEYLLGEQSLHRGQVSAIVISLQAVLFLT